MLDFTSPQKKAVSVEDVLDRIRERTRLNRSRDSDRIRESLARLTGNILQCQQLQNTVGGVNPRNSGPLNAIIQSTKRVMARALSWYSRPIQQYQTAAIRALSECATALDEMNQNVDALSDFSQSLVVDLDKKISQLLSCADSHLGHRAQRG